jgi:hypothetical protein
MFGIVMPPGDTGMASTEYNDGSAVNGGASDADDPPDPAGGGGAGTE